MEGQGAEVLDKVGFVGFRDGASFSKICGEDVVHFFGTPVDRGVIGRGPRFLYLQRRPEVGLELVVELLTTVRQNFVWDAPGIYVIKEGLSDGDGGLVGNDANGCVIGEGVDYSHDVLAVFAPHDDGAEEVSGDHVVRSGGRWYRAEGSRRKRSFIRCSEACGTGGGMPGGIFIEPWPPVILENSVSDFVGAEVSSAFVGSVEYLVSHGDRS